MPTNGTEDGLLRQHLNLAANSLLDRASLVQSLMGGSRDIDRDCNYPKGVVPRELYQELYDREPVAARVVEVYPKECWQVQPSVYEDEDSETETAFEAAWSGLATSVRAEKSYHQDEQGSVLWEYLYRADVLSGIGHYGIILLGIDDGKDLSEPADLVAGSVSDEVTLAPEGTPWTPLPGTPEAGPIGETGPRLGKGSTDSAAYTKGARTAGFANGKNRTWSWNQSNGKKGPKRKLTFLRVFPESMAWIDQFDSNPASPRFGQPVRYTLLFNDPAAQAAGVGLQMITAPVHWTRVIHVADNLASSEVFGVPRMQAVLNRLLDIRKIHGGSAEMYWRGAFPGYALETLPQLGSEVDIDEEGVKKMMWDWANGLQRHVVLTGLTMKSLSPQVTDPSPQVNTQIEAICIKLGVPIRIFKGSERGELASSQDDAAWNDRLKQRQAGYVTPRLIVPFVDRLVALGVLPAPEGYSVWWPDLTSKSDQEKAAIASQRTTGLVAYGNSASTQDIITPTDYLIKVQGFDEAEAQSIVENAQAEKDKREKEQSRQQADQLKQQQDQAEAEHQRQLELVKAKGPQQPPPGATGDGSGDGGTGSVPPTSPGGSPGGSSGADAGVQNYDPDQPRDEGGKWSSGGGSSGSGSNNPHEHVEIHDSGTGEVFWHGPRHEAEQMLREQEQVEPGHGLKVRPYDPAAAEARQRQEEARQQAHEEGVSEARRQESLRSPHGLLPGHKDYVDPPERLYHATLAADEIKKSGFKSSDELGHATLGGSSSHLVSFTTRENADHYARALDVARQAARGELGHDDLVRVGQEYGVSGQRMRELVARHSHNADPATTSFGVLQAVSFEGKKFPLFMGTGWGEHLKSASPASVVSIPSRGLDTIYYNPGEKEWRVGGLKGVTVNYDPDQPRDPAGTSTGGEFTGSATGHAVVAGGAYQPGSGRALTSVSSKYREEVLDSARRLRLHPAEVSRRVSEEVDRNLAARGTSPHLFSPASHEDIVRSSVSKTFEKMLAETREKEVSDFKKLRDEVLAKPVPPPKELGPSAAKVEVLSRRPVEAVEQRVKKVLGDKATLQDVASLTGAPHDATVTITPGRGSDTLTARVRHQDYVSRRTIYRDDDGKLVVHNDEFFMKSGAQGKGLGAEVFTRQVENAQRMGVDRLETHAAGQPYNGYYTWPRFGYDQSLSSVQFYAPHLMSTVKEKFPAAESVGDLMLTPEGRSWWKERGTGMFNAVFDLKPGSRSLKVLHAYHAERASKEATTHNIAHSHYPEEADDIGNGRENFDYDQDTIDALDAVWDKLHSGDTTRNYDPSQPRDESGRWSLGAAGVKETLASARGHAREAEQALRLSDRHERKALSLLQSNDPARNRFWPVRRQALVGTGDPLADLGARAGHASRLASDLEAFAGEKQLHPAPGEAKVPGHARNAAAEARKAADSLSRAAEVARPAREEQSRVGAVRRQLGQSLEKLDTLTYDFPRGGDHPRSADFGRLQALTDSLASGRSDLATQRQAAQGLRQEAARLSSALSTSPAHDGDEEVHRSLVQSVRSVALHAASADRLLARLEEYHAPRGASLSAPTGVQNYAPDQPREPTADDDLAANVAFFDPDLGPIANASGPTTASPWGPGVDPSGNVDEATQADVDAIADQADGPTATANEVASPPPVFGDEDFDQ